MIFYQTTSPEGLVQLAPTQAEAKAIDRNFIQVDVPTDKQNLMVHINDLHRAIHATETVADTVHEALWEAEDYVADFVPISDSQRINNLIDSCKGPMPKPAKPLPPVYATVSITIDDEWDKLPLPRQLHFAALAMEAARERISA